MPFSNDPDQFFISGGDHNVLLRLIGELRDSLLSMQKYNPGKPFSSFTNTETLARFIKLRLISSNYRAIHKNSMNNQNRKIKAISQKIGEDSKETIDENTFEMAIQKGKQSIRKKNITDISKAVEDENTFEMADQNIVQKIIKKQAEEKIPEIFDDTTVKLHQEKLSKKKKKTDNYKFPKDLNYGTYFGQTDPLSLKENKVFEGFTFSDKKEKEVVIPSTITSVNLGENPMPIHGQPIDNKSKEISEHMANTVYFSTVVDSENEHATQAQNFKGWGIKNKNGSFVPWINKTFTKETPFSKIINQELQATHGKSSFSPPGTYKFFIEKLHGRYGDGTPHKKNQIASQHSIIGDMNLSNRMLFAAYIDNFFDNYIPEWNKKKFIGRGESVPIYQGTDRSFTCTFSIVADYSTDMMAAMNKLDELLKKETVDDEQLGLLINSFPNWGLGHLGMPKIYSNGKVGGHIPGLYSDTPEKLWQKITFLAQACYPYYRADGKMKEQPIIRIRVADFYDVTGYITNFQLDMSDLDNIIDLNPSAIGHIPFTIKVTLQMGIIHEDEPSDSYYGFYNRKEFDEGTMNSKTGENIPLESQDVVAEGTKKKSPLSDLQGFNEKGMNIEVQKYSNLNKNLKDDLKEFKKSLNNLRGSRLESKARKEQAEKAMKAFVRIDKVVEQLAPQYTDKPIGKTEQKGKKITKEDLQSFKDQANEIYNNTAGIANTVSDYVNNAKNDLKLVGVNLGGVEKEVEKAKQFLPVNIIPKTLGDIIDKFKK